MSKRNYREIISNGLILLSMTLFGTAICNAADEQIGKENPFKIVEPAKINENQIIESVKGTGITQAQLQAAIREAMMATANSTPRVLPVETEPVEVIPERHIKSIMLKFLRAANVLTVVSGMLTPYGNASIDLETNTLIVCDSAESLERIIAQVAKADKTPQLILVEVVIVDVQLSNDTELGVNWDNLSPGSVSYTQTLNELTTGGSLTMIRGGIENTINALQKERNTEILASPRVLVLSGQEASFETVEQIPYTEKTQSSAGGGGDSAIASTNFKDAGITLTVRPTVTDEGMIMIYVDPRQSINTGVAGVGQEDVPIIDIRGVKTTLLMKDGEIAVIGGLRSKDVRVTKDKIPLLGDLPFIGGFFSNDKEVVENSELLILISPHVYTASDGPKDSEEALWHEVKSLKPVRLSKTVRPENEYVRKRVPQNKPEKK